MISKTTKCIRIKVIVKKVHNVVSKVLIINNHKPNTKK